MTVTSVKKNPETTSMTITAAFDAPIERIWQLWEDPRQLERWWGPPTFPATFVEHDLSAGGRIFYYMTGPNDERPHGWWRVRSVDAPHHIEFESGFADADGVVDPNLPTMDFRIALREQDTGGTSMTIEIVFVSLEEMETIMSMGMEEGMTSAVAQMDAIL